MQTVGHSNGCRDRWVLAHLVPGELAADRLSCFRVRGERRSAAARRRIAIGADILVAHRRGFIIYGSAIALDAETRPFRSRRVGLTEREIGAVPRELQRIHVAHRLYSPVEHGLGVLGLA